VSNKTGAIQIIEIVSGSAALLGIIQIR